MPFIPIIAAVAAWGIGGASVAAVIGGSMAIGAIATTVAVVGATVGAIGAVTGNKTLKTAGLIMGAVGGVVSLANAVGAFGEGATLSSVFGGEANAASGVAGTGVSAAEAAGGGDFIGTSTEGISSWTGLGDAAEVASWTGAPPSDMGGGVLQGTDLGGEDTAGLVTDMTAPSAATAAETPTSSIDIANKMVPEGGNVTEGPSSDLVADQTVKAAAPPVNEPTPPEGGAGSYEPGTNFGTAISTPGTADNLVKPAEQSYFDKLFSKDGFLGTHGGGLIGAGLVQVAGQFLGDAFDPTKPAQVKDLEARANANQSVADLNNKKLSNMNSPIPIARYTPVTGRPGIINNTLAGGNAGVSPLSVGGIS